MPSTTSSLSTGLTNDVKQYDSQASLNSDEIVAGAKNLTSLIGRNKSGVTLYLMIFDAIALPPNGTVPKMMPIPVPAGLPAFFDATEQGISNPGIAVGLPFGTGIYWAASTTADTLTIDATSSMWVTARYT